MLDTMPRIWNPTRFVALLAITVLAACGESPAPSGEPAGEPGGLAIVGAQLVDGTGADPVADAVVVIRDGRVAAAGPRETTAIPDGAEVLDATGQTIIPGLVDTHSHYPGDVAAVERQLRTQLYYGVTTARSIGSDTPEKVALMLEANAGRAGLPRMFTAGLGFTHPGGFNSGSRNEPTTVADARELVREQAALGAHFIKMWVNEVPEPGLKITSEIRTAIIDEAITNGLVPVAHFDEEADGRQLIEAGLKDLLHSSVRTFGPGAGVPMDDPEPSQEFLQMARENDVVFSPTLSISQNNWHFAEHPELLNDPELRAAMNPDAVASWDDPDVRANVVEDPGFEDRKAAFRQVQAFVKTIHDAGISVALGTDSGTRNVPMGWGTHHELELYVEAGLTPMQALVAATATGAQAMPPLGESDFGTLEVGKIADLILLDADPLADIRNTLAIDRVMQRGEWVDRDGLLSSLELAAQDTAALNRVIERLRQDRPVIGSFTRTARPDLDFVVIDAQDGTFDIDSIRQILGGLRADGPPAVTPIVRIPYVARDAPHAVVKQLLDVGVFGVMFPDIETRDQAIGAIGSMRFAQAPGARDSEPAGLRAAGSGSAPRYWGLSENDYGARADLWPLDPAGQLVAMLQIESLVGIDHLDEILDVPGIGAIFLGPTDLAESAGEDGPDAPRVEALVQQVLRACLAKGVPCGYPIVAGTREDADRETARRLREG